MTNTVSVITDVGLAKITTAAGTSDKVEITQIALGDANGVSYDPDRTEIALVNERDRYAITNRWHFGPNQWWIEAARAADGVEWFAREIGFLDADGDLIALVAGANFTGHQIGLTTYRNNQVLDFSDTGGLAVVEAPDNTYALYLVNSLTLHANHVRHNLEAFNAIQAITGYYPEPIA